MWCSVVCVCLCVRACVRACMRACIRVCVRVYVLGLELGFAFGLGSLSDPRASIHNTIRRVNMYVGADGRGRRMVVVFIEM